MKNLQQIRHVRHEIQDACISCYRQENIVTAVLNNGMVCIEQLTPTRKTLASFDTPEIAPEQADKIVNLHYSEEDESLCLIMQGGDIILVQLDSSNHTDSVDIIGTIDQQVLAAEWSPDNDIVAITTQDKMSLLTKTFDSLAEIQITDEDIKASANQVSVGWGRAETQFRGKHAPRDPTLPESIDEGTLSGNDDLAVRLSWRGDAAFLSLSMVSKGRRVIRVYSREGVLESTSEPVNGQEGLLSWKPSGNLIASIQRRDAKDHQCIFFEKNGLRHGEFDLRSEAGVVDLRWNCDSSVLAVQYGQWIDLWVASNYHYALKSRVPIESAARFQWHAEDPLCLTVTSSACVLDIAFRWHHHTHTISVPNDFGLMVMIDGTSLGLTPIRLANVPPPMSFRTMSLPETPRDVAVSDDTSTLFVLFSSCVRIYGWNLNSRPTRTPQLISETNLTLDPNVVPLQIVCNPDGIVHVLLSSSEVLRLQEGNVSALPKNSTKQVSIIHNYEDDSVLGEGFDGSLQRLPQGTSLKSMPEFCHTIEQAIVDNDLVIFGLAHSGKLYANGVVLTTKVTSFLIIDSFLAYTTSNFLKFIHLKDDLKDSEDDVNDERCRQIERGSILVCSCPSAQSITLQAPRGNLETVYPRLLVLSGIRIAITNKSWAEAWRKAKVHRIDTNIMCDHSPELFLSNLKPFISELRSSTELDLFLSGLKAEDVTITMYENTLLDSVPNTDAARVSETKINNICDSVLSILQSDFSSSHLTSILTAHLSKSPADYEAALRTISLLPQDDVEGAIVHVCFLADAHLLYNQALGLYDLPLALLLAQKSQKDPREYVPFLQSIQIMPLFRQRFSLDDHLGRHEKALGNLFKIEDAWEEAATYVETHTLWQPALQLLRHDRPRTLLIMALYADYLRGRHQFSEAAYAFEIVGDFESATDSFEAASLWPEALQMASSAGIDPYDVASRMVERMIDQSKFSEAATIYHGYLNDDDSAIQLHCRAYEFSRAMLLAAKSKKIDSLVKPGLTEAFVQISELLSEMRTQLNNQLPRLREVREKRDDNPELYFDGVVEDDTPDNVSLAGTQASTSASVYTRYTGTTAMTTQSKKSGKARRRQERQRAKGKKGTIWEEEYLVNSIRRLVERLEQTRPDARSLVIGLVRCDMRENAWEIQKSIISLITLARANLDEVFSGILTLPEELQRTMGTKPELGEFESFELC